jgi:transcriptional regulator with XRE-family HTH domain
MASSGQFLREARRRAGLTQRSVARRAGVSQPLVARIERGEVEPSFERLRDLVRACGFDLDVRVVPLDEDAWAMVEELQSLSPDERVERLVTAVRLMRAAQGEGGGQ